MRTSITVACAKVTAELKRSGKDVFSDRDIRAALTKADRQSATSMLNYMGRTGYLVEGGFLARTVDGYELSDTSMRTDRFVVDVAVKNPALRMEV